MLKRWVSDLIKNKKRIIILVVAIIGMSVFVFFQEKSLNRGSQDSIVTNFNVNTITSAKANDANIPKYNILGILNWPTAVLIFAIIFIAIFYKQISEFINRTEEFKAGVDGIEANTHKKEEEGKDINEKKEEQISDETYEEEKKEKEDEKNTNPQTLEDWRGEMIMASIRRNKKRADEAYEMMKTLNADEQSKKEDEIIYLECSHILGNTESITKLKSLLSDKKMSYRVGMALGFCYQHSDDLKNACSSYEEALKVASDDNEKSSATISLASVLYKDGKKDKALGIISDTLVFLENNKAKLNIYEALADIYDKESDYENKAFAIEKALEIEPNNTSILFKAGYSYSEGKYYDEVSLLHYVKAKNINPNDNSVLNNLGVQYEKLNMPIKSITNYKSSEKQGSTLSTANLAYRYLDAGFSEEASGILNIAKNKEDVHPNVNEAISDIPSRVKKEDEEEKRQIEEALSLRKFFLSFADAKFIKRDDLINVSGQWEKEKGTVYNFNIIDNRVEAYWKEKLWNYEYEWKLEGVIVNNSSSIEIKEKDILSGKYARKRKGLLFYLPEERLIKIMEINESSKTKTMYELNAL